MFEPVIQTIALLRKKGINSCLVGELVLSYYNVPRVINEIEVCVPSSRLSDAIAAVEGETETELLRVAGRAKDVYNAYKNGFPVFNCIGLQNMTLVVIPDRVYGLDLDHMSLITSHEDSIYSKEILEEFSASEISRLPFPCLRDLLAGLCQAYALEQDMILGSMAEQLVDGMNVNRYMCQKHLGFISQEAMSFIIRLADGRSTRLDTFRDYQLTCYVSNQDEVRNLMQIPGHFAANSAPAMHVDCCLRRDEKPGDRGYDTLEHTSSTIGSGETDQPPSPASIYSI